MSPLKFPDSSAIYENIRSTCLLEPCSNSIFQFSSREYYSQVKVTLWVSALCCHCSNVLEENIASIFMAIGFVGVNAKMTHRKNFVGYVEQFEIVLSIIAMMVVGGERTVLITVGHKIAITVLFCALSVTDVKIMWMVNAVYQMPAGKLHWCNYHLDH